MVLSVKSPESEPIVFGKQGKIGWCMHLRLLSYHRSMVLWSASLFATPLPPRQHTSLPKVAGVGPAIGAAGARRKIC